MAREQFASEQVASNEPAPSGPRDVPARYRVGTGHRPHRFMAGEPGLRRAKEALLRFAQRLRSLFGLALSLVATGSAMSATLPPNIVFLLADDLGATDLGCYGADLHETPHLDRLAREGVRFTQAYAMSVCSPTRAALLTGRHAARLHFTIWREGSLNRDADIARFPERLLRPPVTIFDLPVDERTLPQALSSRGYLNLHVGKWHLGDLAHAPERYGFDASIGGTHWGAPATYFHPFRGPFGTAREFRLVPGLGLGRPGEFLTDRLTDQAISWIEEAGDRPFFLNLWFHNPHTPIEGKPDLVEHFRQRLRPGLHHQNPEYAAMIRTLDDNVGRLLATLERQRLADRTLVVFMSDNGGYTNIYRGRRVTDNSPLRSGKGSLYEGGIRVPLIVRWPGTTPPGSVCDEPVICMDLFRTFCEAAEVEGGSGIDGLSLVPLLRRPEDRLDREALFFHYPHYYSTTTPVSAVREGDWKLIEYYEDRRLELYDLRNDPGEQRDLAEVQTERAQQLQSRLRAWRAAVGAQDPVAD